MSRRLLSPEKLERIYDAAVRVPSTESDIKTQITFRRRRTRLA